MDSDDTKGLILIVLVTGLLIVTPYFVRMWQGNTHSINSETYEILRLYNNIGADFYDTMQERHVMFNILYFLPLTENYGFLMTKIIVFVLALITIILAYLIMKRHNFSEKVMMATLLLLIASPIFINTYMDFSFHAVTILLALASIYFLSIEKNGVAAVITFIIPFIDVYSAVIIVLMQALYIISKHNSINRHKAIIITGVVSIIFAVLLNYYLGFDVLGNISFEKANIITDIGANVGFSFSSLLLSIIGMILLWNRNWKNISLYSLLIVLMVSSIYLDILRIYLNLVLVIYAGFAFVHLSRRKWSITIIKRITMLLIICSILFTTLVFITRNIEKEPNNNYVDALNFLSKQAGDNQAVLSSEKNGYIIEYYSGKPSFIDHKSMILSKDKLVLFENISTSRNLERTESILKTYKIRYIFIDTEYKEYLEDKEGLLFLIATSNKFKEAYKNKDIQIWMYTG